MNKENCPDFETLSAYADGEISQPDRALVELHLEGCGHCKQNYSRLLSLHENFETLRMQLPQIDIIAKVHNRIEAPCSERRRIGWLPIGLIPFSLAASVALVVGIELGSLLTTEHGAVDVASAARMAPFSAIPPGNVCLGHTSCYTGKGI